MDLKEHLAAGVIRHPWEQAKLQLVGQILAEIPANHNIKNILDIGCGDGYIITEIVKRYASATAYAVDTSLNQGLIERLELASSQSKFYNNHEMLPEIKAELVLLLDVLEHLENDQLFLQQLVEEKIQEQGWMLLTVPALPGLFSGHDRFLEHYRRYTLKTLIDVVEQSGLKVEQSGYAFSSLIIPRTLELLQEKLSPREEKSWGLGHWRGGESLTKAVAGILIAENRLSLLLGKYSIKLPGLTVWTLCQKP